MIFTKIFYRIFYRYSNTYLNNIKKSIRPNQLNIYCVLSFCKRIFYRQLSEISMIFFRIFTPSAKCSTWKTFFCDYSTRRFGEPSSFIRTYRKNKWSKKKILTLKLSTTAVRYARQRTHRRADCSISRL